MTRSALISGCSSGIGLASARALARHGLCVFAAVRNPDGATELRSIADAVDSPGEIRIVELDVSDETSVLAVSRRVVASAEQGLEAVVHNAGVNG